MTGGHIIAGFHEVVISSGTIKAIEKRKQQGNSSWRISSTLFGHVQSDYLLEPLAQFVSPTSKKLYPPILVGDQVTRYIYE